MKSNQHVFYEFILFCAVGKPTTDSMFQEARLISENEVEEEFRNLFHVISGANENSKELQTEIAFLVSTTCYLTILRTFSRKGE